VVEDLRIFGQKSRTAFSYLAGSAYAIRPIGAVATAVSSEVPAGGRHTSAAASAARRTRGRDEQILLAVHFVHRRRAHEISTESRRPELFAGVAVPRANVIVGRRPNRAHRAQIFEKW
jgi:hypothetical protein